MDELAAPLLHRSLLSFQLFPPRPLLPSFSILGHSGTQSPRPTTTILASSRGSPSTASSRPLSLLPILSPIAFWRTWKRSVVGWLVGFFSPVDLRASLHPFALLLNPNSPSFGLVLRLNDNLSDMPGRIYNHNLFQNWKPFN